MDFHVTYIGTATMLLEIDGLRLLTDPVFDPAGSEYRIGKTRLARYINLDGPAVEADALGPIDAVLLSHDQHRDNLDRRGRELVKDAPRTLTTPEGAGRLARHVGERATGLRPFEQTVLRAPSGLEVRITGMPARHGPPGTEWLTGTVTGFLLEWEGQRDGGVYISGDTRYFQGIHDIAARTQIGTCFIHAGSGCFPATGPVRYSMDGAEVRRTVETLSPARVVPIHFEGWSHFSEDPDELREALRATTHNVQWLPLGTRVALPA
ncbi:MAG: MBL fold metallo-hydrolase [Myxococcota bacterium]